MRRRLVPVLLALLAVAVAAWRFSRRRAAALLGPADAPAHAESGTRTLRLASPLLLEAGAPPSSTDDAEIADATGDRVNIPHPQVEREERAYEPEGRGYDPAPRFVSLAWTAADAQPGAETTELRVRFGLVPGEMRLDRIDVRETASQVFVTVLAWWEPPAAPPAEADRDAGTVPSDERIETVALREPLGDRTLVHAPHDHPPA